MGKTIRPLLRYHGGKWILAPWIISHFPKHRVYTESFGGGGSVLLRKARSYGEVYNDLDNELVNLFTVVREQGKELKKMLFNTPFSRKEFELSYLPSNIPIEQARRTVVRSFMGFGSNSHNQKTGFRANSNRSGTTPAHDWANYQAALDGIIDRLRGVVIENRKAIEVIHQHDQPDCLHYIDPPYLPETRDKGSDYRYEMTKEDHEELAHELHLVSGMVVLSGYRSELYDELYRDWKCIQQKAYADGARERIECLWINQNCSNAQTQLSIF